MGPLPIDSTQRGPRAALGPAAVWLVAAAVSSLIAPPLAVAVPVAGALGGILYRSRPLAAAAVAVVAALGVCGPLAPGWALLGVAVALAVGLGMIGAPDPDRLDPLEQHLARCRRSEHESALFVARCASPDEARRLAAALRLCDSRRTVGREVQALVDVEHLDRSALEQRLTAIVPARFGWAAFPTTSPTLAGLVRQARAAVPEHAVTVLPAAPVASVLGPGAATAGTDALARTNAKARLRT